MSGPDLRVIDLPTEPDKLAAAVESLKRVRDYLVEYQRLTAAIQRARYLALIDEGFTKDEALALCRDAKVGA